MALRGTALALAAAGLSWTRHDAAERPAQQRSRARWPTLKDRPPQFEMRRGLARRTVLRRSATCPRRGSAAWGWSTCWPSRAGRDCCARTGPSPGASGPSQLSRHVASSSAGADVSHLAHAKAANASGQRILMRRRGVTPEQVARVFLAGAFANALDVRNAVAIGLLAPVPVERARRVGNASVRGAKALLLAGRRRRELEACSPGSSTSSPNPSRTSSICSSTVAASHRCRRPGVRSCFGALWGRSLGASSTTFGSGPAGCDASSACPSARAVPSGRSRESAT